MTANDSLSQPKPVGAVEFTADVLPTARALERVLTLLELPVDPVHVRRVVREQLSVRIADSHLDRLHSAAEALGLKVRRHAASVEGVLSGQVPFPAAVETSSGTWWVVRGTRVGAVQVDDGDDHSRPLAGPALASALGMGTGEPGAWLSFSPAAPLQALVHGDDHGEHPSPWARVRKLVALERDDVSVLLVYAVVVGVLSLATPIAVQSMVNTVAFGSVLQPVVVLAILFFVALSFESVLRALEARVVETLQARLFARTALDLSYRFPRVRVEAWDQQHGPEVANRFLEVVTVQKASATLLTQGVELVLQAGIGMLVLAFYHPLLLAFDVVLVLVTAAVILLLSREGVKTSIDESYAKYGVLSWMQELARGVSTFRTTGGTALAADHSEALVRRYLGHRAAHFRVVFRQMVGVLSIQVVASTTLLVIGGYLVIQRQLTLGQLVASELIVAAVTASLSKFGKLLENAYDLVAGADKLGHLVELPLERGEGAEVLPAGAGLSIALEQAATVKDGKTHGPWSLALTPGARVAIVADEGAARVAFAELASGLRAPTEGMLTYEGLRPEQADGRAIADRVALLRFEDVFSGTVFENVALGRLEVSPLMVREALARVGLLDAVLALDGGLEAQLTPTGAPLSWGQVQQLLVARALVASPRLVVVDLPLDALAPTARAAVLSALLDPKAPWSLLMLTGDADGPAAKACGSRRALADLVEAAR